MASSVLFEKIDAAAIQVKIDRNQYCIETVYKCFYWYTGKYEIDILSNEISHVVTLSNLPEQFDLEEISNRVRRDLIDFKTREIISTETKNIRDMLIAKAFFHGEDLDEVPPGDIEDPVGFKPSAF